MGHFIIKDATLFGEILQEHPLDIDLETITVRDLIAARVTEEVGRRNKLTPEHYRYLVDLAPAESRLNAMVRRLSGLKAVDAENPILEALQAFERNVFFVLVGDRQVTSLEEVIPATAQQEVTFIKLTQLIGG
ncbi:hypothetical protein QWY85_18920 [Neolewinella lacunae]|uniref:Uncharacterized protein n=1 Tax=Neolewinella lacunae TaxID=1517758 RepID=A0A923PP48_9BACT|nr:hypothetical protein [Neolewinella lacunae]MBC6994102.1 hypothetical protein [Neolewinella lacunae]MDN3636749.1 hypothetical protein [Neolewinella lacunae]